MGIGLYNNMNVQKRIESLKDAPISDVNKKLIFDFIDYCFSEGLSQHRILKYISILKCIAIQIQIDFDKIEKRDLYIFISDLERSDKSEWVKHDYKISLKKFYKWQCDDERPELTKWIKTTMKKRNQKLPFLGSLPIFCKITNLWKLLGREFHIERSFSHSIQNLTRHCLLL